ncbi:MAG: IS66 family transposase [Candidatus Binatus sp.]
MNTGASLISSQLFESYLECSTKCWLRSRGEPATANVYAEWIRAQKETYLRDSLKRLLQSPSESDRMTAPPIPENAKDLTWRLAVDVRWRTRDLESSLQAVERLPAKDRGGRAQFIAHRFEFANKLTKEHKLLVTFDALLLSEVVGRDVKLGKIVHGDKHAVLKVNTLGFATEVRKRIEDITALLARNSPPDLVLNRHCGQCEFQTRCRVQAREKDELSLLSGMSAKDRKRLHDKGIFTVTQLSHTFRPRRRRRNSRGKQEKHHYSLQALAIRENKIHAVDIPAPNFEGTLVFLDVEGLPDRDFYYLIGMRVQAPEGSVQHSFWADNTKTERLIWNDFLAVLSAITNPHLIHYGSYETTFLKRMRERYGGPQADSPAAAAVDHSTNLLSFIYAQIYFPTYSNGLKEIAGHLGFRWSGSLRSGSETIVWRHRWEVSGDPAVKQTLLDYNRQDCEALELLANRLVDLHRVAAREGKSAQGELVLTSNMKGENLYGFGRNEFVLPEMETINKAAYWDYQRERVYVKSNRASRHKRGPCATRRRVLVPNTTVEYPRPSSCPTCKSKLVYAHGKRTQTVIDLRFMQHGVKRWVTRYIVKRYRCPSCRSTFYSPDRQLPIRKYGPNLVAYTIYQNIDLQLPQIRIARSVKQLFGLHISRNTTNQFKAAAAQTYEGTYSLILKRLCSGRLLHVDETSIGVKGREGYVWVLASLEEVAYFYTATRAGDTMQEMLKDFSGVLVSDFYAAYNAVRCFQQKCLIHFIRDVNDELLKHPYDDQLKRLVGAFASLVKPMIETVDRHGLKKRFLGKHRIFVDRFYKRLTSEFGAGEAARKIIERLQKNRNTMFTFLGFDDVPWNNNNAEHAIKAFATLRRVIEGTTTEKGLGDFLVLLSVCETCKYKNVDFLDFLRSGSRDISDFANNRPKQRDTGRCR